MQYTATSFAQPLTRILQPVLHAERERETVDRALTSFYLPLFAAVARAGRRVRAHHQGRVTGSLLYIGATMLVVLALLLLPGGPS